MPLEDWLSRPLPEVPKVPVIAACIREFKRSFPTESEAVGTIIQGTNERGTAAIRLERVRLKTKQRFHYTVISEYSGRSISKTNPWKTNKGTVEEASSLLVRAWAIVRNAK